MTDAIRADLLKLVETHLPKMQLDAVKQLLDDNKDLRATVTDLKEQITVLKASNAELVQKLSDALERISKHRQLETFEQELKKHEQDISTQRLVLMENNAKLVAAVAEAKSEAILDVVSMVFKNTVIRENVQHSVTEPVRDQYGVTNYNTKSETTATQTERE